MTKPLDDDAALEAFMNAHSYDAEGGLLVKNIAAHPVHARQHRGNAGAYFKFDGLRSLEAHISEIPAGSSTKMHRHMCEALFYVLAGEGHTVIRGEDGERKIAWRAGDVFNTPMMCWHQHFNDCSDAPARYFEITTLPLMKLMGSWVIENHPDNQN